MSKWIRGFPPNRKGNYLVHFLRNDEELNAVYIDISRSHFPRRAEYDPDSNLWIMCLTGSRFKGMIQPLSSHDKYYYDLIWWDEFSITEDKKKLKLKF